MPYEVLDPATATVLPGGPVGAPGTEGKNLASLRAELGLALGTRTDVSASRLNEWINDAYSEMADMLDLSELKGSLMASTVVGVQQYLLPSGVWVVRNVSTTDPVVDTYGPYGRPLRKVGDVEMWRRLPSARQITNTRLNIMSHFFQYNRVLAVYPKPNLVSPLVIDFTIKPQALVADDDCPVFERGWHVNLVDYCRYIAHKRLMEPEYAADALNQYLAGVRQKRDKRAAEFDGVVQGISSPRHEHDITAVRGNPYGY